jgi:hypothetical protein
VQRWSLQPKPYSPDGREGGDAFAARLSSGKENTPEANFGVLYENGQKIEARESGADPTLHSEPLLIGGRVLGLGLANTGALTNASTRLASFGKYRTTNLRGQAELYTERAPCPSCRSNLDVALRADDVVSYSVPFADSATMRANLAALLSRARSFHNDEAAAREMEQEEADRALDAEGDQLAADSRRQALSPWERDEARMDL